MPLAGYYLVICVFNGGCTTIPQPYATKEQCEEGAAVVKNRDDKANYLPNGVTSCVPWQKDNRTL